MPKTITVASQKGGVAKTTTCISLGASLAERDKRVLLVDLDPQAHLTLSLGLTPGEQRQTVVDALLGKASLSSTALKTDVPLLDVAPANQQLGLLDKWLYGRPRYESFLKECF
ncbi:MAG: AAA family ATPase, partial [Anaerolineae bacterium]